jgi:cell wall-associated NlpC family hydrolase
MRRQGFERVRRQEPEQGHAFERLRTHAPSPARTHATLQRERVPGSREQAPGTTEAPPQVYETLQSSSQPLEPEVRESMEARLGHDFSRVRVHFDASADASARAVGATAYTVGSHVVFRAGAYQPDTGPGRRLLAHELTHVVQQSGTPDVPPHGIALGDPSSSAEHEARHIANLGPEAGAGGPSQRVHGALQRDVSFELSNAPKLSVPTSLTLSEDEMRVLAWLRQHQSAIIAAEQKYRVDRRAIAAAIAWEALANVKPAWRTLRAVGPGKVHYKENFLSEGNPIAKETEAAGYLPARTEMQRMVLLSTTAGSIEYIAAIMAAIADAAGSADYDLRTDPVILTNVYQGSTLRKWKAHLAAKTPGAPMSPGNPMGIWTRDHLDFLQEAVGEPALPEAPLPSGTAPTGGTTPASTSSASSLQSGPSLQSVPPEVSVAEPEQSAPDPGQERARVATETVDRLKAAGTKYGHELVTKTNKSGQTWQEANRDWGGTKEADCSKFVQWALEGSGEADLFGRENAQTGLMQSVISQLAEQKKSQPLRADNPKVGDLILWTGHVAIVTELKTIKGVPHIVFAHMGLSGASVIGRKGTGDKAIYWLKVDALPSRKELASGDFLGYWTPP